MPWIKTIPFDRADDRLRALLDAQHALYPPEYAEPVPSVDSGGPGIVAAHTLIPEALYHSIATFGALRAPDLPLGRRHHEMIATMVSVTNRCHY